MLSNCNWLYDVSIIIIIIIIIIIKIICPVQENPYFPIDLKCLAWLV